jgi:subtilisin family serine protease
MVFAGGDKQSLQNFVKANPGPQYVAQDTVFSPIPEMPNDKDGPSLLEQSGSPTTTWGLDRIDADTGMDGSYQPPGDGTGVHVYVLDTGVRIDHEDFGGRAKAALEWNGNGMRECAATDVTCAGDTHGHGTHCAGTVGGTKYGVAKKASLYGVKVLWPSGYTHWICGAMDWVIVNGSRPAVMSMSLGGPGRSPAYKTAVDAATNSGVTVVIAAGNSNRDAKDFSPAFVPSAITVGSTTSLDTMSGFSNYGPIVDIFAPGTGIESADARSKTGSRRLSGTSMACPHVAGAVAVILQKHPNWKPSEIANFLEVTSSKGKITGLPAGSPNKFLWLSLAAFNMTTTTTTFPGPTGYGFYVTGGPCVSELATGCVTSDGFQDANGQYGNKTTCEIAPAPRGGKLHIVSFNTELTHDKLTVQGTALSGEMKDVQHMEGTTLSQTISWTADYSVRKQGWKICNINPSFTPTTTTTSIYNGSYTFKVTSGPCVIDAQTGCATSDNFPQVYSKNKQCELQPLPYGKIHIEEFSTETRWDKLQVEGKWHSGELTNIGAVEGTVLTQPIKWVADTSEQTKGWKICNRPLQGTVTTPQPVTTAQPTAPVTTAEPSTSTTTTTTTITTIPTLVGFLAKSGPCTIDAVGCAASPNYPDVYGSHEKCTMMASEGQLQIVAFKTEDQDYLTLNGKNYSGNFDDESNAIRGLNGTSVKGEVAWYSDETVGKSGWKLCILPTS